jgi:Tfp pilus assembly PilM family ATPase
VDGLALLNAVYALRPGQEPDEPITDPVAVLHVGHTTTTLAIGAPGVAPFVRDIPYAGQAVMAGIADHLEIKPQEVLQHLRTEGVLPDEGLVALHQACQEMAEHVRETLRYHAAQQAGPGPASVWLSGGFASVPGFAEQLDRALNRVTIRVWDPLKQLGGPIEGQTAPGPAFAVAVGLAMRVL